MDVEKVRRAANWCRIYGGANDKCTATALLRILDAFEVMEREHIGIIAGHDGFVIVTQHGDFFEFADPQLKPLAALLAAADKLKGASDADSK